MTRILDDLGQAHSSHLSPARIVSLVPSDTFSVVALGAGDRLVGRTDYCVEPADLAERVPAVGGTKNPDVEKILALAPNLVFANQEENSKGDIQRLIAAGIHVYVGFPKRAAEGIAHLAKMARVMGIEGEPQVRELVKRGYDELKIAEAWRSSTTPLRAFVPIWMEPLMTVHGDTFISDMMDLAGAYNVFCDRPRRYPLAADLGRAKPLPPDKVQGRDTRYPRVTMEEVIERAPELVLLPDEPHPFSDADADVFRATSIPASHFGTVVRVPGKDLCWPGAQSIEGMARTRVVVQSLRSRIQEGGPS